MGQRIMRVVFPTIIVAMAFGGCDFLLDPDGDSCRNINGVTPASDTLLVGETRAFSAAAYVEGGAPGVCHSFTRSGFQWTSSTPAVATVSQSGVVTARAAGRAMIRARRDKHGGEAQVFVVAP